MAARTHEDRKAPAAIIVALLVFVLGLSVFMIVLSNDAPAADIAKRDLIFLEAVFVTLRDTMQPEITTLGFTAETTRHYIDLYLPERFPGTFPIWLSGVAANSTTVLGLTWNHQPQLEWVMRELRLCHGVLTQSSFGQITVIEARRIVHLARLTTEDGASLDENLNQVWSKYSLDESFRGDRHALEKWAAAAVNNVRLSSVRQLSDTDVDHVIDRVLSLATGLQGVDTKFDQINKVVQEESASRIEVHFPVIGYSIPGYYFRFIYPVVAVLFCELLLSLWFQLEERRRSAVPFSITTLLGIRRPNKAIDLVVLIFAGGSILAGAVLTAARGLQTENGLVVAVNGAAFMLLLWRWATWTRRATQLERIA